MANEELEDFGNEQEEPKKKVDDKGGFISALIIAIIFGAIVNAGMYFAMRGTLEEERVVRMEEKAIQDSLAVLDSIALANNPDSLLKEPIKIDDESIEEDVKTQQEQPAIEAVDSSEVKRDEKIKKVAKILSAMEPKQAAASLSVMDEQEAAMIMSKISARASGEIFNNLHPNKATAISRRIMNMDN